jgi:flagellar hook-length control protein FliK
MSDSPVLDVKEFKLSLKEADKESSKNEETGLLGIKNFLNSAGLKMMSLSDEVKDPKWNSAKVSDKTNSKDNSVSDSDLTKEESEVLLYLLSSLFGNRTDNVLQDQISNTIQSGASKSNLLTALPGNEGIVSQDEVGEALSKLLNEVNLKLGSTDIGNNKESLEVIKALAEKINLAANEGKAYTLINLEPSELGKILVGFDGSGSEKNIQIAATNDDVKKMIQDNLNSLQDALKANGIETKELNIKEINFSNSKTDLTEELKSLMTKISNGEFSDSSDKSMLSDNMKDFMSFFVKTKNGSNDTNNSLAGFGNTVLMNMNESTKAATNDIEKTLPTQKIIDSVVNKVTQSISEGKTEIEINLIPENLGKLTVKIVSDEGKLSANIQVKNLEVKQALDAGIIKLKDNLNQNGINVEQINVSLSEDYSKDHQERFFNQTQQQTGSSDTFDLADIEEPELIRKLGYNTLEYIV